MPIQQEFVEDGKKYISAKNASFLTGYTSDYIGQLCRGSKIDCKRIGRVWFVVETDLLAYIKGEKKAEKSEKKEKKIKVVVDAAPVQTEAVVARHIPEPEIEIPQPKQEPKPETKAVKKLSVAVEEAPESVAPIEKPLEKAPERAERVIVTPPRRPVVAPRTAQPGSLSEILPRPNQKKSQVTPIQNPAVLSPGAFFASIAVAMLIMAGSIAIPSYYATGEMHKPNMAAVADAVFEDTFVPIVTAVERIVLISYEKIAPVVGAEVVCDADNNYCN